MRRRRQRKLARQGLAQAPAEHEVARAAALVENSFDDVEHELALLFRRARSMSDNIAREVHPDVEPSAYGLLLRLEECGGARLTDLASYFGVGKPSMSRQVHLLEELGLVERVSTIGDRRVRVLRLTTDGSERLRRSRLARRRRFRALLQAWSPDDVEELGRLLRRFNTLRI